MSDFQAEKTLVRDYFVALSNANSDTVKNVLADYTSSDYRWRGSYPFREQVGAQATAETFWQPLMTAFSSLQRRESIFIAGDNKYDDHVWVMSMGHFEGLFDQDILGIPHTRKFSNLRYAEFNCVKEGKIIQTGLFIDFIGLMIQAGVNPLPPSTGANNMAPAPLSNDGIHLSDAPAEEAVVTLDLLERMIDDLTKLNESGAMSSPPGLLEKTWAQDMAWYGPAGIGATYTIERYREQHQLPFRSCLADKKFEGHVCRFAEGRYACFFGWPNLSNTPIGGWLGLPGGNVNAKMQVVDVYRREGDKLKENWVLIDIPYWLSQQGLDVFERTAEILNPK